MKVMPLQGDKSAYLLLRVTPRLHVGFRYLKTIDADNTFFAHLPMVHLPDAFKKK